MALVKLKTRQCGGKTRTHNEGEVQTFGIRSKIDQLRPRQRTVEEKEVERKRAEGDERKKVGAEDPNVGGKDRLK